MVGRGILLLFQQRYSSCVSGSSLFSTPALISKFACGAELFSRLLLTSSLSQQLCKAKSRCSGIRRHADTGRERFDCAFEVVLLFEDFTEFKMSSEQLAVELHCSPESLLCVCLAAQHIVNVSQTEPGETPAGRSLQNGS